MNYRGILKRLMYKDRADVHRSTRTKIGESDDYTSDFVRVYEGIPCKLSQYGKELSAHRDDVSQKVTLDLRICYDPAYDIRENDVVEVTHNGQLFKLTAGTAFAYPTHVEQSVRRRKEAGQV